MVNCPSPTRVRQGGCVESRFNRRKATLWQGDRGNECKHGFKKRLWPILRIFDTSVAGCRRKPASGAKRTQSRAGTQARQTNPIGLRDPGAPNEPNRTPGPGRAKRTQSDSGHGRAKRSQSAAGAVGSKFFFEKVLGRYREIWAAREQSQMWAEKSFWGKWHE